MIRRSLSEVLLVLLFILTILAAVVATSADAAPAARETTRDHRVVTPARAASARHRNDVQEPRRAIEEPQD